MRSYVGITVGPIFDTICDASTPAALWFASSLFSDVTKRICAAVTGPEGLEEVQIYSPYYSPEITMEDGVGKFHDRIIFSAVNFEAERLNALLKKVKRETVLAFPEVLRGTEAEDFFEEYLQLHYVVKREEQIGAENSVLVLSPYLDALELMKTFPKDDAVNPIRRLFLGEKNNGNKYIKESPLFQRVPKEANQFRSRDDSIWTVEEVASWHDRITESWKRKHYYAVVSADGDEMGKFLKQISSEQVTEFSKACLEYDEAAAALIGAYGGMTIYAGGDDLLFLAPLMTEEGNVFQLCHNIQQMFREKIRACASFEKLEVIPSISFSVSIQYAKYPLYEALDSSRYLLALAKKDGDFANTCCRKNNMLIGLQKHSGQSLALLVSNEQYGLLEQFLQIDSASENKELHSVLYTLENFRSMIFVLNRKAREEQEFSERYLAAWYNFFDNAGQKTAKEYIRKICMTYYESLVLPEKKGISVPVHGLTEDFTEEENADASLKTLLYLLKLKQFLTEKEGA
ncbi:MAG: hypothetical protein J6J42_07495 [Lachnospiraceae bacterium]|nr:hypothetical protein [Lachnospiraceae bacterium]